MSNRNEYEYRAAYHDEWQEAMELAWRVFLKFDAADYSALGVKSFHNFISDNTLYKMFRLGSYQLFGAYDKGKMVGMISLRNEEHISLLFVDEHYQKKGIGRNLIDQVRGYLLTEVGGNRMTVNASPMAVGFYHRLGFTDLGPEQITDGIRYTPMQFYL